MPAAVGDAGAKYTVAIPARGAVWPTANAAGRVLVIDETRRTGGVSEGIVAELVDAGYRGQLRRVTSKDSFIPLGPAADLVLLGEDEIIAAARAMVGRG